MSKICSHKSLKAFDELPESLQVAALCAFKTKLKSHMLK